MSHDPLASLDIALLLMRDPARRVLAKHAELATPMDEGTAALFRWGTVSAAIESVHQAGVKASLAWGCRQSPALHLIHACREALVAIAVVMTPEELGGFLADVQRRMDAICSAPAERSQKQ